MNYDEFAFFNQQLAAMLRDGIPLEGALARLCADMKQGKLRLELEKLGGDIVEIADAILQRLSRRASVDAPEISAAAMAALEDYPFPGNVRELENVLERALTLSTGGVIAPEHVRLRSTSRPADSAAPVSDPIDGATTLGTQLESIERDAIVKALEKTRYNKTAAAKLLGMSFRALRYRIKKLGIE